VALIASAAITTLSASTIHASGFDVFGIHPIGIAEVSSRVAGSDDGSASFYNPGGLSLGNSNQFELSLGGLVSQLEVQGSRSGIDDPLGGTVTAAVTVPFEGPLENRIRVGVAMHSMTNGMLHLKGRVRSNPSFPYYDNRTQRVVIIPALSVRVSDRVGIGAGVNTLAGVQGAIDVREGQSQTMESRIVQEAGTLARVVAGVRVDLSDNVRIGAVYRQSFGMPLTITTVADIAGVPLTVDVSKAGALFDPATLAAGIRFGSAKGASVELDVAYHRWSEWEGPVFGMDTTASALSLATKPSEPVFRDTVSVRMGGGWIALEKPAWAITAHLGAGYETSMVDRAVQQGEMNLVDGAKAILGAGLGLRLPRLIGDGVRVSLGMQAHHVGGFGQEKIACASVPCPDGTVAGPETNDPSSGITNPGYPRLSGGGMVFIGALGVGVDL